MQDRIPNSPEFRRLVQADEHADLTTIAIEIARDAYPKIDQTAIQAMLDRWAARVRDRCPDGAGVRQILAQINRVLFEEERFQGNTADYEDPRNSYINQVIDRRLGIPISLSVIYLAIADRIGLAMAGVNLPYHFIIRTITQGTVLFVDPFHQGALLDRNACAQRVAAIAGQPVELHHNHFSPATTSTIVARILRNLKAIYWKQSRFQESLPVLRRLLALAPNNANERFELGSACLRAHRPAEALDYLESYRDSHPNDSKIPEVEALIKSARRLLANLN